PGRPSDGGMTVSASRREALDVERIAGRTADRLDDRADVRGPEDGAVVEARIGEKLRIAGPGSTERADERKEKPIGGASPDRAEDVESGLRHDGLRDSGGRRVGILFETERSDSGDERRRRRGTAGNGGGRRAG